MSQNPPPLFGAATGPGQGQAAPSFPDHQQHPNAHQPFAPTPAFSSTPQQSALQQNTQLPGVDMSALAGVSAEQFALIAQLLRSGALPPPPPPPSAPAQAATNAASSNSSSIRPENGQQEVVDADMEEGEVEEGEVQTERTQPAAEVREIPKGPRNAASRPPRHDTRNRPSSRAIPRQRSRNGNAPSTNGIRDLHLDVLAAKNKQTKDFILAMHHAGYTYQQLAQMVEDPKHLRKLFLDLGLPVSSDYNVSSNAPRTARTSAEARSLNSPDVSSRVPAGEGSGKASSTSTPNTAKPSGKTDRSAYLAKLQALKAGKAAPSPTQPPPQHSDQQGASTSPAISSSATTQQQAPVLATSTPTSKAVKTELARQRLEAFKAEQAARLQAQASSTGAPTNSHATVASAAPSISRASPQGPSSEGLGAGLNAIAASAGLPVSSATQDTTRPSASEQPAFSPRPPTPSRSFSGLPGLFMAGGPQQAPTVASSQPSRTTSQPIAGSNFSQQQTLPRKRLLAADSDGALSPQVKRPFGQSRSASEDESFIIENSEDEDEDTRMHIDSAPTRGALGEAAGIRPSLDSFAALSDFQQGLATPGASGSSAPGVTNYEQKLKAIEELNRKIAEKEAKAKAQGRKSGSKGSFTAVESGLPGNAATSRPASAVQSPDAIEAAITTPSRPASAAATKLKQQKEELRQRIAELENARQQAGVQTAELRAIPSGVETTSEHLEGPSAIPSSLPNTSGPQAPPGEAVREGDVEKAASDDGELNDESDFDFYGDEEPSASTKSAVHQEHIDSQTTTASAVTEDGVPTAQATDSRRLHAADEDLDRGEEANSRVSFTEVNTAAQDRPQPAPSDDYMDDDVLENVDDPNTTKDSDVEMESEDDDDDDSSDEDENELDAAQGPEVESSDAWSTHPSDSEEYQPEPTDEAHNEASHFADKDEEQDAEDLYVPHPAEVRDHNLRMPQADEASVNDSDDDHTGEAQDGNLLDTRENSPPDDELATELQPSPQEQAEAEPLTQLPTDRSPAHYTPYNSILTKFKDYRYHPQYLETVPGGFKSRTYNHQIDPTTPLCQIDAQGGKCQDKKCAAQHFDKMGLSDNVLLRELGTKNVPAHTKEEMTRWNSGLHGVINTLKADNVKDAPSIAAAIAKYRREFRGDETKGRLISFG